MKRTLLMTQSACAVAVIAALAVMGCSGTREPSLKGLRAEIDDLTQKLDAANHDLQTSEALRAQIDADNRELHGRIAGLEQGRQAEVEKLQRQRDNDAAVAAGRIRGLNAQVGALRGEVEARDALNAKKDAQLREQTVSINQLNSSISAHQKQILTLEQEKTRLAENLRDARKRRAQAFGLSAVVLLGTIVVGYVTRNQRLQRSSPPEALLRMQTAQGNRKIS